MFRPSTPPASLIILAAMSWPSRTCAPWLTDPGRERETETAEYIGHAAHGFLPRWPLGAARMVEPGGTLSERTRRVEMEGAATRTLPLSPLRGAREKRDTGSS